MIFASAEWRVFYVFRGLGDFRFHGIGEPFEI